MIKLRSIKKGHHKAGKSFVLMFNRVSMYGPAHPYSVQAVEEFFRSICDLLKTTSPVVLLYSRGQFFLEDEPLDPSLNYFKMASHFKKAEVTSIAVMQGVQKSEVEDFIGIFLDTLRYPTADRMKAAAKSLQMDHIRINHVSYKKVTEDDQIVLKSTVAKTETLTDELEASKQYQEALGMIAGKLLMEEVDQGLTLKTLISDPVAFSKSLVARGVKERGDAVVTAQRPAHFITEHLAMIGREIEGEVSNCSRLSLTDLANALVKMKNELQDAIDTQKSLGILLDPAGQVTKQTEELSDTVVLELIKKEYDKGKTSIKRLAFVLQRIVTPAEELQRLLPKIRDGLISEGMPLSDFSELIKHMGKAIQNAQLVEWVNQGAEAIGVNGADLVERWRVDPSGLARFLYLATEIDRQAGSREPLCDILVGHIERFGPKLLAVESSAEEASEERLQNLAFLFNSKLVEGLRGEGMDAQLVNQVEARLKERLDASVQTIRAEFEAYKASLTSRDQDQRTLLQCIENSLTEDQELKQILRAVRASKENPRLDENDFQQIFERIQQVKQAGREKGKNIHDFIFTKKVTYAMLEKEISRSDRYGTDLSGITFSILCPGSPHTLEENPTVTIEVIEALLSEVNQQLRSADWMGALKKDLFVAILPMTTIREAHLTARRLLKRINSKPVGASHAGLPAKIAGSVIHYDKQTMPNADAFVRCACSEHAEMIHRLLNLQEFM